MPSGPAVTATLCTTSTDDEYELHVSVRGAPPPQLVEYWSRRSWFAKKLRTENGEVYDRIECPDDGSHEADFLDSGPELHSSGDTLFKEGQVVKRKMSHDEFS